MRLKPLEEVMDVPTDLIRLLFVNEVAHSSQNDYILQKWNISFEPSLVYVIFDPWSIIGHIQIPNNKLRWNFNLSSSPWCCELPVTAQNMELHVTLNLSQQQLVELFFEV